MLNTRIFGMQVDTARLAGLCRYGASAGLLAAIGVNFFVRGGHDDQRALESLFLFTLAAVLVARPGRLAGALAPACVRPAALAGFFVLGVIASIPAFSMRFAFYEVATLFLLLLSGLAMADEIAAGGAGVLVRIFQAFGAICMLYLFRIAVVYVSAFAIGAQPDALDFTPGFSNYRFFNHMQTATLPLLVALTALAPRGARTRWAWALLAALWWALLAVTSARGTMAGLGVGCVVALTLRRRHAWSFLKAMALTAVGGLAVYAVFFFLIPEAAGFYPFGELGHTLERTIVSPVSGRAALWTRAAGLIGQHPLLGVGPLHFAHYASAPQLAGHPHDWALQIGAEWGMPALLCLCAAIGAGALALVRSGERIAAGDEQGQVILAALLVAGAAILVDGLVSGLLVMPQSQLAIALYIGCAVGWTRASNAARHAAPPPPVAWRVAAVAAVALAMLGLAGGVWPEIGDRVNGEPLTAQQAASNHGVAYSPRLWLAGFF